MELVQINKKHYAELENIIKTIAECNHIEDVSFVDVTLDKTSGIISFMKDRKAQGFDISSLFSSISKFLTGFNEDPEINEMINNLVQTKIEESGSNVIGKDKQQYVDMIKGIVYEGGKQFVAELQQQRQQPGYQQSVENLARLMPESKSIQELQRRQQQGTPAQKSSYYTELYTSKYAVKGIFERMYDSLGDSASNFFTGVKTFLVGANVQELSAQLAELCVKKGFIAEQNKDQFAQYISTFVDRGFQQAEQTIAAKQQESEKESGDRGRYERDQAGQQVQYQRADGGVAYKVDYNDGKPSIYVTAEPPNTLVDPSQITGKVQTQTNVSESQQSPQQQSPAAQQPGAAAAAGASAVAARAILREKQAIAIGTIIEWILEKAVAYGPTILEILSILLQSVKDRQEVAASSTEYAVLTKEAALPNFIKNKAMSLLHSSAEFAGEFVDGLRTISSADNVEAIENFMNGPFGKILGSILVKLGVDRNNLESVKESIPEVLKEINNVLMSIESIVSNIKGQHEEAPGQDININPEDYKVSSERNIMKINSNVLVITADNAAYKEIEGAMRRIAMDHSIDNVASIDIELSKEGSVVHFNQRTADMDIMAGIASALASKFIGGEESGWETGAKALEAGLFNMGAPIGQAIAKYMGGGLAAQLIAGGIGALAWGLLRPDVDEKKNEAMNQEAMSGATSDPAIQQLFDTLKEKYPDVPESVIWKRVVGMLSQFHGGMQ